MLARTRKIPCLSVLPPFSFSLLVPKFNLGTHSPRRVRPAGGLVFSTLLRRAHDSARARDRYLFLQRCRARARLRLRGNDGHRRMPARRRMNRSSGPVRCLHRRIHLLQSRPGFSLTRLLQFFLGVDPLLCLVGGLDHHLLVPCAPGEQDAGDSDGEKISEFHYPGYGIVEVFGRIHQL